VSFIQNISNRLLSKKEAPKVSKQFLNWNQLSSIVVIAYDNQLGDVVEFINTCKKSNITIKVAIIYNGKPENAPKPHFEHIILDKKQFSFFGVPKEETLQLLNAAPIDALINLGNASQTKATALSKLITAKCKVSSFQDPIFDISIDSEEAINISGYLQQVVVYLNMIKTT